jgi:hypothetical protein
MYLSQGQIDIFFVMPIDMRDDVFIEEYLNFSLETLQGYFTGVLRLKIE